jgi:prophage DNA circulation protein
MPSDPAATAGAIVGVTGAYAQAIVDGAVPLASDPSGGLADLANWGADILAANSGSTPTLALRAANAVATVDLVRGAAVVAVAQVYAGTDWTSANAARDQLASVIDARTLAAAAAGQDSLYAAWQALASVALQDLALRAQQLPRLVGYTRPSPPAALALAYRLYQDSTRATQLVALNDAPHPLFMQLSGQALAA